MAKSKMVKTMEQKHGRTKDGRLKFFVDIGSKGGKHPNLHGFTNNAEQAKKAGSLSKRGKELISYDNAIVTYRDKKTGDILRYDRETNICITDIKRIKRGTN